MALNLHCSGLVWEQMAFAHTSVKKAFFQEFIYLFKTRMTKQTKRKTTGGNKTPNNNLLLIVHAWQFAVKTTHSIGKNGQTANGPENKTQRLNSLKQTGCHLSLYTFCLLMKGFTSFVNTWVFHEFFFLNNRSSYLAFEKWNEIMPFIVFKMFLSGLLPSRM